MNSEARNRHMSVDSGTRLLPDPIFYGTLGLITLQRQQRDGSQGSGGYLFLTVEETAGVAQGARMSLKRPFCVTAGLKGFPAHPW